MFLDLACRCLFIDLFAGLLALYFFEKLNLPTTRFGLSLLARRMTQSCRFRPCTCSIDLGDDLRSVCTGAQVEARSAVMPLVSRSKGTTMCFILIVSQSHHVMSRKSPHCSSALLRGNKPPCCSDARMESRTSQTNAHLRWGDAAAEEVHEL